jgi:dTDP-4-dehydrorhamnose 3,5-epimerase
LHTVFQTLEADTTLLYHHSAYYQAGAEGGIRYDDPSLGIEWKLPLTVISARDQSYSFIDSSFEGIKIPV